MKRYEKVEVNVDPFPFRVGAVRLAYPGTMNGQRAEHDPRPGFDAITWREEQGR